jgi:hypothetical protein
MDETSGATSLIRIGRPSAAFAGRLPRTTAAWVMPLLVTTAYLVVITSRLVQSGPLPFVHFGHEFLGAASTSSVITPKLGATSPVGYDGQYYFALALDPIHAKDYIAPATSPGYVYSRPLYPAVAGVLGFGSPSGVAYAMLFINVVAVFLGTLAVALWLKRRAVSPAYSLLYGFYPGLVFSVFRDLTEPLAYGLVACAVYFFDRRTSRSLVAAGALLALAALTRETTAIFAFGLALALVVHDSRDRAGLARLRRGGLLLASSVVPLLVWRLAIGTWLHSATQERPGDGLAAAVPFHAYLSSLPWTPAQTLVVLTVVLPTLLALSVTVRLLRRRIERLPLVLLALNALALVAFIPKSVFVDYGAEGRAVTGVLLCAIYCLPLLLRAGRERSAALLAFGWSAAWLAIAGPLASIVS